MRLLILIDELSKRLSVMPLHSPILLSYPNATIYDFDNNMDEVEYEEIQNITNYINWYIDNPKMMTRWY